MLLAGKLFNLHLEHAGGGQHFRLTPVSIQCKDGVLPAMGWRQALHSTAEQASVTFRVFFYSPNVPFIPPRH